MNLRSLLLTSLLVISSVVSSAAHADGLTDLKSMLQRPAGQQPLKVSVSVKTEHHQGEGKDATTDLGAATLTVDDDAQGLQVHYGADALARVQQEHAARDADAMAKTPTIRGLEALDYGTLNGMLTGADKLKSLLADATFKSESADSWNGRPARLLNFDLGPGKMREQDKKYIKHTEGTLQIWIAADGTPLESRTQLKASGRAFLVITFETLTTGRMLYERVGDRLIVTHRETFNSAAGAGEKGEDKAEINLQIKS